MRKEDVVVGNYNGFGFMLFFVPRAPREIRPIYRTSEPSVRNTCASSRLTALGVGGKNT